MSQNMIVSWRRSAGEVGAAAEIPPESVGAFDGDLSRRRLAPHAEQNFASVGLARPQAAHALGNAVPHCPQNLLSSGNPAPQLGQCIAVSPQAPSLSE